MNGIVPLTKQQLKSLTAGPPLKDSSMLAQEFANDGTEHVCYNYVDFAPAEECGDFDDFSAGDSASLTIKALAILQSRVDDYPKFINALGKQSKETDTLLKQLDDDLSRSMKIMNGSGSKKERRRAVEVPFRDAKLVSERLAKLANVSYSGGGCGAGEDDSQTVSFNFVPKPKSARYILEYDFEQCQSLLKNPYDPDKCDAWQAMLPEDNYLSGNYRYRVVWSDGQIRDDKISFNGTKKRTVKIEE
jgi:hypothetical protein